jgi:integrase
MLNSVNARLKAGKVKVQIEQRGEKLYLVATLPPKPNSDRTEPYQQRIALGINANSMGFKHAELEAKKLGVQLAEGSFAWEPKRDRITILEAIELFKEKYFVERGIDTKTKTTWSSNYGDAFKKLPNNKDLTPRILLDVIKSSDANTRSRQLMCQAFKALATEFDLELDVSKLKGNYSQKQVKPRLLPTDAEIEQLVKQFSYEPYRWAYGMMATYALRNHEVFLIDLDYLVETGICYVTEKNGLSSKSHSGKVWPLYPHWVDLFALKNVRVPNINGKSNRENGQRISRAFNRASIPFPPYNLRHCWARRSIELGLDSRLAAQQMRHSHQVHTSTYNAWLTESDHAKAWEKIRDRLYED